MKNNLEVKPISFEELKRLFKQHVFAIPYIQREFVWTKKKTIRLLDSIKKQYPIGSFLICKIPAKKHEKLRESPVLPAFNPRNKECFLIVDGQQRLSVLYSIVSGKEIKTKRYSYPIESTSICLTPARNQESEFEFYDTERRDYIRLTDILNDELDSEVKNRRRVKECFESFEKYSFPFIFIDGFDEKKMEQAFIRLNVGGTPLSAVDKFFAEAYHKDTDLRAHVNNLIEYKLKNGFQDIDRIHIVKSIAANLGHKEFIGSTLDNLARKLKNPREKYHKEYIKCHTKIENSIMQAADFLTDKFKDASYIPYPAMVSMLSIFYFENNNRSPSKQQIDELMKWFWATGFTQRYSGKKQRYNLMNDAEQMKDLAHNKDHKINLEGKQRADKMSISYLMNKVKYYTTRGTMRNTFFCYLISKTPREFFNGEALNIKNSVSSIFNSKNDHHIFPKDILKKSNFYMDEINKIGNICFLKFGENIKIKNKPPWVYLKEYQKRKDFGKILSSHVIPDDPCVMSKGDVREKYGKFIKKRTELVKKDLIHLLGNKYIED